MLEKDPLPIPIKAHSEYDGHARCLCKNCNHYITYDHMHAYVWNKCHMCKRRIWYNLVTCTLYAYRWKNRCQLICFDCRYPYYKMGMSSGDIHRNFYGIHSTRWQVVKEIKEKFKNGSKLFIKDN